MVCLEEVLIQCRDHGAWEIHLEDTIDVSFEGVVSIQYCIKGLRKE